MSPSYPSKSVPLDIAGFCKPSLSSLYNLSLRPSLTSSSLLSLAATNESALDCRSLQHGDVVSNETYRHEEPSFMSPSSISKFPLISSTSLLSVTPLDGLEPNDSYIHSVLNENNRGLSNVNLCHSYPQPVLSDFNTSLLPQEPAPFFEGRELYNGLHSRSRVARRPEICQEDVETSHVNTCSLIGPQTRRLIEEIRAQCSSVHGLSSVTPLEPNGSEIQSVIPVPISPVLTENNKRLSNVNPCHSCPQPVLSDFNTSLLPQESVPFFEGRELYNGIHSRSRVVRRPEICQEDVDTSQANTCSPVSRETIRTIEEMRAQCCSDQKSSRALARQRIPS